MSSLMNLASIAAALALALTGCGDSRNDRTTRAPGEPASAAAVKGGPPVKAAPADAAKVTASSQTGDLGPAGLLAATSPGWHAAQPPKYPESLTVDFLAPREVKSLGLLQQEGQPARAPKAIRVETSADGAAWTPVAGSDNACTPNVSDGWANIDFIKPVTTRYLKIVIFSNCGDKKFLTLRGLRFG